jgi:hypothetical protein
MIYIGSKALGKLVAICLATIGSWEDRHVH